MLTGSVYQYSLSTKLEVWLGQSPKKFGNGPEVLSCLRNCVLLALDSDMFAGDMQLCQLGVYCSTYRVLN